MKEIMLAVSRNVAVVAVFFGVFAPGAEADLNNVKKVAVDTPTHEVLAVPVRITTSEAGVETGRGSGFFYHIGDKLFVITNRHIVISEERDSFPDTIFLNLHVDPKDLTKNEEYVLKLYDGEGKAIWLEHPVYGARADVVAVPIEYNDIKSRFVIKAFSPDNHIPKDVFVPIGADVLVLGYPLGIYDTVNNLPIARNAVIASAYDIPFEGAPYFLIDSWLHVGSSGSPVITKASTLIPKKNGSVSMFNIPQTYLVGIHSHSYCLVKTKEEKENEETESNENEREKELIGLNVVWFASLIPEIISGN
ncbi:MAG: serine protease [bacterium]